jgi:glyoxylase-like metal-dependent hydrolase (beta-lactamase superfamily II)
MSSRTSDIKVPGPPETQEVADGVWAYIQPDGTWWINNTGFLTGPQGVISIDACSTERRTRAYQAAIAAVTPAPVRAVVSTHHHGDHTFGNCLFPGAALIGHELTRAEAIAFGPPRDTGIWDDPDWGDLTLDPPFITFTGELTLHAGDIAAQFRHVGGPAHTTNDSVVWIPDRSVLFAGDLIFNGGTPFVLMGSVAGAVSVLAEVIAPLNAQTWTTCGSCSTLRPARSPRTSPRWPPPATRTWAGSPPGPTASASSATCTAPAPSSAAPRLAAPSTSSPRSPTWSPTTAAGPCPAAPDLAFRRFAGTAVGGYG